MKKSIYSTVTFLVLTMTPALSAWGNSPDKAGQLLSKPTPRSEFRIAVYEQLYREKVVEFKIENGSERPAGMRSVGKAALFSGVIPGAGQFYSRSYLKGFAFLAIEALSLFGHVHYQNRGNDMESQFEQFANSNWVEEEYWDWMSQISGISRQDLPSLRDYENANFSHFLPERKNQTYYENIGKYKQFAAGWVDFDYSNYSKEVYLSDFDPRTPLRVEYMSKRKDANDTFRTATTMATVVLFNHVVSALDAAWTMNRFNRRQLQAKVGMNGLYHERHFTPMLLVSLAW